MQSAEITALTNQQGEVGTSSQPSTNLQAASKTLKEPTVEPKPSDLKTLFFRLQWNL